MPIPPANDWLVCNSPPILPATPTLCTGRDVVVVRIGFTGSAVFPPFPPYEPVNMRMYLFYDMAFKFILFTTWLLWFVLPVWWSSLPILSIIIGRSIITIIWSICWRSYCCTCRRSMLKRKNKIIVIGKIPKKVNPDLLQNFRQVVGQ